MFKAVLSYLQGKERTMRTPYPSDISREQFAKILPILETARKRTKPRTVDLYDVFCGVCYVLKSGCQWRMLPSDLPNYSVCYSYFSKWKNKREEGADSLLEVALKKCSWRGETKQWSERKN